MTKTADYQLPSWMPNCNLTTDQVEAQLRAYLLAPNPMINDDNWKLPLVLVFNDEGFLADYHRHRAAGGPVVFSENSEIEKFVAYFDAQHAALGYEPDLSSLIPREITPLESRLRAYLDRDPGRFALPTDHELAAELTMTSAELLNYWRHRHEHRFFAPTLHDTEDQITDCRAYTLVRRSEIEMLLCLRTATAPQVYFIVPVNDDELTAYYQRVANDSPAHGMEIQRLRDFLDEHRRRSTKSGGRL